MTYRWIRIFVDILKNGRPDDSVNNCANFDFPVPAGPIMSTPRGYLKICFDLSSLAEPMASLRCKPKNSTVAASRTWTLYPPNILLMDSSIASIVSTVVLVTMGCTVLLELWKLKLVVAVMA